jgi:transcriptional regulator with XRE-family HTH domain
MSWITTHVKQTLSDVFEAAYDPTICGYSKAELTRRSGVSQTAIWRLRKGKTKDPHISTVLKLCRAVGMDMELAAEQLRVAPPKPRATTPHRPVHLRVRHG